MLVVNGTTLSASNLGDSGFVLVRDGVATFQCPQQQHNFNFPFQLGSADSMSDQPQAAMVRGSAAQGGHRGLVQHEKPCTHMHMHTHAHARGVFPVVCRGDLPAAIGVVRPGDESPSTAGALAKLSSATHAGKLVSTPALLLALSRAQAGPRQLCSLATGRCVAGQPAVVQKQPTNEGGGAACLVEYTSSAHRLFVKPPHACVWWNC